MSDIPASRREESLDMTVDGPNGTAEIYRADRMYRPGTSQQRLEHEGFIVLFRGTRSFERSFADAFALASRLSGR